MDPEQKEDIEDLCVDVTLIDLVADGEVGTCGCCASALGLAFVLSRIREEKRTIPSGRTLTQRIEEYQREISPEIKRVLGRERLCMYEPSCSEYAKQAIGKYGSVRGIARAIGRLLRCNHLFQGGYDPA